MIPHLAQIFAKHNSDNFFINTNGAINEKLGVEKCTILNLVGNMFCVKNAELNQAICESNILKTAGVYFKDFPNNNIYATIYGKLCREFLESENESMVDYFLGEELGFIKTVKDITYHASVPNHKKINIRQCNMGHVILMLR